MPSQDAPVKASVIRSHVLVFAKGVVVRTDATKALKVVSAAIQELQILCHVLLLLLPYQLLLLLPFPILMLLL
jgi:hypothetical protein